MKAWLCG